MFLQLNRFARRRRSSVLLVGLLSASGSAAVSLLVKMPEPAIHDEFSYLLAADTFASGRVTNPTHPMWVHFEDMHTIQRPTYMSKYPPGQALMLAAGIRLTRDSMAGVWLSMGLACAAICWMLQAWLPARWALTGGLLAALNWGIVGYWSQSYWGGGIAALGGALVFGALPRILRFARPIDFLWFALGLAILANSRPAEGFAASIPANIALLRWMRRKPPRALVVLPLVLTLAATAGTMAWYNYRITGHPLVMPYQVHQSQYMMSSVFLFGKTRAAPVYHHKILRDSWSGELEGFRRQHTWKGFAAATSDKLRTLWKFFLGPVLTLPVVLALPRLIRERRMRFVLLTLVFVLLTLLAETVNMAHYAAPVACLIVLLTIQAIRHIATRRSLRRFPIIILVIYALRVTADPIYRRQMGLLSDDQFQFRRARLLRQLEKQDGNHLVLVRYRGDHDIHQDWVHNRADIDQAKVVWAREMDESRNRGLLEHFKNRRTWLLEPDESPPRFRAFSTDR